MKANYVFKRKKGEQLMLIKFLKNRSEYEEFSFFEP